MDISINAAVRLKKNSMKKKEKRIVDDSLAEELTTQKTMHKVQNLLPMAAADREYLLNLWSGIAETIDEEMFVGYVDTKTKTFRYTPRQMWTNARKYMEYSIEHGQPLTLSGVATFCDIDTTALFNAAENYPEGYGFLLQIRKFIIMYNELAAHKKQNPAGPIFLLKNLGFKDKFEIEAGPTQGALSEAERAEAQRRIAEFSEVNDAMIEKALRAKGKPISL